MRELERFRGVDFVGVDELAEAAARVVVRYRAEPARGNVSMTITPRIVRHYLSEGLLGEPAGHSGVAIVFRYPHLLRLLAVKKLLADHWSVVKIREFMQSFDTRALEQIVADALMPKEKKSIAGLQQPARSRDRESATKLGTSPLASVVRNAPSDSPPKLASLAVESAQRASRKHAAWVELVPGLEVRVRRRFDHPTTERGREKIVAQFRAFISRSED